MKRKRFRKEFKAKGAIEAIEGQTPVTTQLARKNNTRGQVGVGGSNEKMVIVFAKGYTEPEIEPIKGKKKQKEPKWSAFLSSHTRLHSSTIIRKYAQRWPVEVCFKECKQ